MLYTLGYPNFEVRNAFTHYLIELYTQVEATKASVHIWAMIDALEENNLEVFFDTLKIFFAKIDYQLHISHEKYYQSILMVNYQIKKYSLKYWVKGRVPG